MVQLADSLINNVEVTLSIRCRLDVGPKYLRRPTRSLLSCLRPPHRRTIMLSGRFIDGSSDERIEKSSFSTQSSKLSNVDMDSDVPGDVLPLVAVRQYRRWSSNSALRRAFSARNSSMSCLVCNRRLSSNCGVQQGSLSFRQRSQELDPSGPWWHCSNDIRIWLGTSIK